MKWTDDVTLKFVKLYMKFECLWNPAHPDYKFKYRRERVYEKLCQEFEAATQKVLTKSDVKNKIRNLRTTYSQQVHKILIKSSPDSIYEPSLIWFEEMDRCLKNISGTRATTNNKAGVASPCHNWNEKGTSNNDVLHPDPLVTDNEEFSSLTTEDTNVKIEANSPIIKHKKDKKNKIKRKSSNCTDSGIECLNMEDEFDNYGRHVASQLRSLNLHTALKLQLDIQNLISEVRLADLHNETT